MTNHSPGGGIAVLLNRVFGFVSLGGETNKEAVLTQVIVEALEALVPGITTLDHVHHHSIQYAIHYLIPMMGRVWQALHLT